LAQPLGRRVLLLALFGGLAPLVAGLWVVWHGRLDQPDRVVVSLVMVVPWLGLAFAVRNQVVRPLQTLANLMAGLRTGDFTLRARGASRDDPLGAVHHEFNSLGEGLQAQRLGALEATALLRSVMEEIDVAVFAFDEADRLQLVNRAGERLLGQPSERMIGRTAEHLGLAEARKLPAGRTLDATFPGGTGRWEVRRSGFRQGGRPMDLVVLADVSRALREEERLAWRRLVRVLSHEINNSLAPIQSLAGTLTTLLERHPRPEDAETDIRRGLDVIGSRAESLARFMAAYARLARLPAPEKRPVDVGSWVRRVAGLEGSPAVRLLGGPPTTLQGDPDQLDQLLINLVKNAREAAGPEGAVEIGWTTHGLDGIDVSVRDTGPGLPATANLFVPFFTTKPGGTGIGLVLSRQIAEAHGGQLTVENRPDRVGAIARLVLPLG
jgi:PAS domain S-box-containing protein